VFGEWPLIGRADELRLISELSSRRSHPAGVVLAGPAGVGKTRLAREAVASAARCGAVSRWATASASARRLPFGAFSALLGTAGMDSPSAVHRAISALLNTVDGQRVLLAVDDAHLLDELAAMVLHQLVVRRAASVVITLRTGEPAPDAVTTLWKDGLLHRLDLEPFAEAETVALLNAVLAGPVDGPAAARLHTITQGNALYLRQLVDGELESGRLSRVDGIWRWTGQPGLTPGLTELVAERIGALSDAQRDVLDLLAFGEPLPVDLLARLTDRDALEQVEGRGLVALSESGARLQVRLAHPLFGEVQRSRCGALRARRLRGRLVDALGRSDSAADPHEDYTVRRAVLALDSDHEPDPVLYTEAAQSALHLTDCALAERLASAAIAAGGGFEPRLTRAVALSWLPRGVESEREFAPLFEAASTDVDRARVVVPRVSNLFWTIGDPAKAERVLQEGRHVLREPAASAGPAAVGSVFDAFLGRTAQAEEAARGVLADPLSTSDAVLFAVWGLVTSAGGRGRLAGVREAAARSERELGSPNLGLIRVGGIGDLLLRALELAGYLAEANQVARHYIDGLSGGLEPVKSMLISAHGRVATAGGQARTAVRLLREGAALAAIPGRDYYLTLLHIRPLAMCGDLAGAADQLARARDLRHPAFAFLEPELSLAHAWVAATDGAISEGINLARTAADQAEALQQSAVAVVALHTAVCFGDRAGADRLAELATGVDGPRAPAAAAHAAALAADDGEALLAASQQCEEFGALLFAADAAAQAVASHTRNNRPGAAHLALARANELAARCENPCTPALRATLRPLPITDREREVITLAARGLSNREIADRLVVSVRTEEGHIYRAGTKLGITSRADLITFIPS
jgi:ATP/maltotriose-dependent transcriptional regulator MalT